ncbi:MAG TPA: hemerythrin domain-containing protein [Rhabdochlamydiaceae bacterium]|jgi:iron-sulfur cluster repair protein YtfE (RIC family)|nr:hemerythrin domain-containing protein [Rhabdochlamydiaceae bacterium]
MSRVDLYTLIHKAQRAHLFALASKIGRTDFTDEKEVNAIEQELRGLISHLKEHSVTEATYIHPLFHEVGDQINVIDEEHESLEKELLKLESILNQKAWKELYPELNRFIAVYLMHQDEEEKLQVDVLWKHFDDNRLGAVMTAFRQSRTPEQKKKDLKFVVFGLSIPELTKLFGG